MDGHGDAPESQPTQCSTLGLARGGSAPFDPRRTALRRGWRTGRSRPFRLGGALIHVYPGWGWRGALLAHQPGQVFAVRPLTASSTRELSTMCLSTSGFHRENHSQGRGCQSCAAAPVNAPAVPVTEKLRALRQGVEIVEDSVAIRGWTGCRSSAVRIAARQLSHVRFQHEAQIPVIRGWTGCRAPVSRYTGPM